MSAPNRFGSNKTKSLLVYVGNLQGEDGVTYMTGTTPYTAGPWRALQAMSAVTFTTLIASNNDGTQDMSTIVLAAGNIIYGTFTVVTLATGSLMAYR